MGVGRSPGREVPMEQFLKNVLASIVAHVLIAIIVYLLKKLRK